uniref:Primase n=1 Tax=viral metagenome TaxID=1070528 RepID=A0A6M3K4Z7_9ZZZZ
MGEVAVSLFAPEALRRRPQQGEPREESWPWLCHWTSCPSIAADKASEGGFVLARLRDGVRRNDCCESVSTLAVDHDAGTTSPERAAHVLRRYRHIIYSTASHSTEAPHWRAIVALSRPLLPDEHRVLWRHAVARLHSLSIVVDPGCSDPARLWYAPTVRPGCEASFVHLAHDGPELDADGMLAAAKAWAEDQRTEALTPQKRADGEHMGKLVSYAMAALRRAAQNVTEASEGERHHVLCREAFSLARLGLSEQQISDALLGPFVAVAGDRRRREGERTIRDEIHARARK